jgi:hypothetical protein
MEATKKSLVEPTHLTEEEANNPMSVIVNHFDIHSSEYSKKDLWEMLKAAVSNSSWTYLNEPGTAVVLEKGLGNIMDALWLLLYEKEAGDGEIKLPESSECPEKQRARDRKEFADLYPILNLYKGRIRRLSKAETENPYLAIKSFFQFHNLLEWKEVLASWKEYALTNATIVEFYDQQLFIVEYEQLEKIIEVAFLLNKESESSYYSEDDAYLEKLIKEFNDFSKQRVSKTVLLNFFDLLKATPPGRLARDLRKMTLRFVESNIGALPDGFDKDLDGFNRLANFLDVVSEEISSNP